MANQVNSFLSVLNRDLTDAEKKCFRRWISLGLSAELISGAYELTMLRCGKWSVAYMDKILLSWHEQGMRTLEEVRQGEGSGPKMSDQIAIRWSEIRKELATPEQLAQLDRLIDLHRMYDGILALQEDLQGQHHDAEVGCLDYRVIKALGAAYELQDYLADRIAREEALIGELPEGIEED